MGLNDNNLNRNIDRAEHQPDARSHQVFSHRFTEVDQFAEFLPYRQYQMVQLSCGSFQSEFLAVRVGDLYFTRVSAYPSFQTVGPKGGSSHLAFALVWVAQEGHFCSHGQPLNLQTDLYGFDMQREAHLVTPPGGIMTNMFVPTKLFQASASQLQRYDLDDRFLASNHATLLPDRMGQIKAYLRNIFWLAQHKPDWLQQPHVSELLAKDFVPLLVRSIPIHGKAKPALKPFRRAKLIARAEQDMVDCLEQPLTLKDLAQRLESSSSALSYGFQDVFGMSPMRYLKVRRLNAVRRLLKAGDPEQTSVRALASRFGFWNTGHFARDYKALFGELPSETLAT